MGHSYTSSRTGRTDKEARDALDIYNVQTDHDWVTRVEGAYLTPQQMEQVREMAYVTLVALADYGVRWNRDTEKAGRVSWSLDLLRRAVRFHEPTRAFYYVRSVCERIRGNSSAAQEDARRYRSMVGRTPWDYYLPVRIGIEWDGMHREDVIHSLQTALRLQPNHWSSMHLLAAHFQVLNRVPEALVLFTACIGLKPDYAWAYNDRGDCYWQLGQLAEAIADFRESIRLAPTIAEFHFHLGQALIEAGKLDEGIANHRAAIRLSPTEEDFHSGLARALQQMGNLDEAIAEYREAIRLTPKSWCAYAYLATLLADPPQTQYRDLPQALACAHKAVELAPKHWATYETLGAVHYRAGNWQEAKAALQKAEELDPEAPPSNGLPVRMS